MATGEFFGRRPAAEGGGDRGGDSDDADDDINNLDNVWDATEPLLNLKKHPVRGRVDEDSRLDLLVTSLEGMAARAGPNSTEEAIEDMKRRRFIQIYNESLKQKTTAPTPTSGNPTGSPTAESSSTRALRRSIEQLRERCTDRADGRVQWSTLGADAELFRRVERKVLQLEMPLERATPPADRTSLVFWSMAARPPWPALPPSDLTKQGVALDLFVELVEFHFVVRASAVLVVRPCERLALLCEWSNDQTSRALAFILAPDNAAAQTFALPPQVLSYTPVSAELKSKTLWRYVGTTLVPLSVVQSASTAVAAAAEVTSAAGKRVRAPVNKKRK